MTKGIDSILSRNFFHHKDTDTFNHEFLCGLFQHTKYGDMWDKFWGEINTRDRLVVSGYFKTEVDLEVRALLRLLTVEDFKNYLELKNKSK